MKEIYECEICGAQYTNWDDAYKCEAHHSVPKIPCSWEFPQDDKFQNLGKLCEYERGCDVPSYIPVMFPDYDENSEVRRDKHGNIMYKVVTYKAVKTNAQLAADMLSSFYAKRESEQLAWERVKAAREETKVAEGSDA